MRPCFAFLIAIVLVLRSQAQSLPAPSSPPDLSQPHPFGVHDMVRMQRVGNPASSPDGQWVVFTVRTWDPEANKTTTNLWLVSVDGAKLRQLTTVKHMSDSSPTWSPDSTTIAFVSNRSGSRQIWAIRLDGGEAMQITSFPIDVENAKWSPAGGQMAFTAEVYPDADMKETAARDKAKAENPTKAMKFERLPVRHWDTWKDGKRSHVFVVEVQGPKSNAQSREAREGTAVDSGPWTVEAKTTVDLMKGLDADCPTKPFGGAEEFCWSPDGKEIAYTAQVGADFAWSTDLNIYVIPVGSKGRPAVGSGAESGDPRPTAKCITTENKATDTSPVYSPDGKTIAYRAMARAGFESDRYRIKLYDRASGKTQTLAESWDRSASALEWSSDSKWLLATAAENARQKIFRVDVSGGQPRELIKERYNTGAVFGVARWSDNVPQRIVFSQDSLTAPAEIYSARLDGSDVKQLTHFTDEAMKLARVSQPAEFTFAGAGGEKVQAWILKPVGFQDGKKYPVALVIHGGPQGAIEDHFHYRWNPQAFAGAGYAVIAINFHGSTGFGQAFTDSISGDWGGKPFEDLMKGLDYALANYAWLDANRVGALGASYGGWMINWINGHTNRFRCLVNHDGGFDEYANYFTTEELWFPEWDFKGTPWDKPELYEKFSPNRYVKNWQTPTLVIHGANDFRVIDAEGIGTFTALQRRGIPSQLLYFPDENHWVLKPRNSIVWHDSILAWLDKWLKK